MQTQNRVKHNGGERIRKIIDILNGNFFFFVVVLRGFWTWIWFLCLKLLCDVFLYPIHLEGCYTCVFAPGVNFTWEEFPSPVLRAKTHVEQPSCSICWILKFSFRHPTKLRDEIAQGCSFAQLSKCRNEVVAIAWMVYSISLKFSGITTVCHISKMNQWYENLKNDY